MTGLTIFLNPDQLQDTPRLFTAIAEWLAVFVYLQIYKRKLQGREFAVYCIGTAIIFAVYQYIAGLLPIWFWIPAMMGAVLLMYLTLYLGLDIKINDCGVVTAQAFVLAEFAASLYRQLYVWYFRFMGENEILGSIIILVVIYMLTYLLYYRFEKEAHGEKQVLNISNRELVSFIATGVGVFIMSNIGFVTSNTPFSASENLLYVRTLVDFGGLLMLSTEIGRRNEMTIRRDNDAINQLFQKQYEQYKLAVDNSEALRREMHDMKHYIIALKNENDSAKRAEIMEDMEQSIAIQEAFMNTGNQVLDVILTTKSLQCEKKNIVFKVMVDGDLLQGIHVKDLCSLFGNILDNAIEATQQIEDEERRMINLSVRRKNQFIVINCENASDAENVKLEDGNKKNIFGSDYLPKTTKKDSVKHGYGLKSIMQVAEKYGGGLSVSFEDGWFKLKVLLSVDSLT
ncbi:MAG: ATP-binding protein [Lachnospiraceae bacterium]|nr:ATP-binding protein [Lachnospiraceae bacterium]